MTQLPLRTQLTLAFLALAALVAGVGVTIAVSHGRIRRQLAALRPEDVVDLRRVDLERLGLEIQGHWDGEDTFVATDVELLPAISDPKLRGAVQAVDLEARTLTLYGLEIQVDEDTLFDGAAGPLDLAALSPGQRVEVGCEVDDGVWQAEKISLAGVKGSDKIKAMVTAAELDGEAPEVLRVHDLKIEVGAWAEATPEGAFNHARTATHLLMAALEFRASARDLLDEDPEEAERARARLRRAADAFADDIAGVAGAPSGPWLQPVVKVEPELDRRIDELLALPPDDRGAARAYLAENLLPFLETDLEPRVLAYLSQSQDELGDQLEDIVGSTRATSFVALLTSGLALLAALVLGFLVWRSIHQPIAALHAAAVRLGRGHLDTRVRLERRDELGELGAAFDRMAEMLAATSMSIDNLEDVFDSMAGALLLLDNQRCITGVNRAALDLLGYRREELHGLDLERVCPAGLEGPGQGERLLLRRDGSAVAVSFSAARLGSNASLRGYVCVAQDLTERKRIEERIRSSLAEKELLLREVHHRVKSNMQVISSLLAMQALHAGDPRLAAEFEESQSRIRSMALIHEQLYQSSDLGRIDVRVYLDVLLAHIQRSHGLGEAVQVELAAEDLSLGLDESLACGLIVNELVVNAFKHAFPGGEGRIRVTLARDEESGEVELAVCDDGRGLAQAGAPRDTLGLSLVATLAAQLGGRHSVESGDGLRVTVRFPLGQRLEVAS